MSQKLENVDILKRKSVVRELINILRTNVRACKALGHSFAAQFNRIYLEMLNVYNTMSEHISQQQNENVVGVQQKWLLKHMNKVQKEALTLISEWVSRSSDSNIVIKKLIPPLLENVIWDYNRCEASAREAKVLSTMAAIVGKLRTIITKEIPQMFDAVFECTFGMINNNFEVYRQHQVGLYELLQQINAHCFVASQFPLAKFELVIVSIVHGLKHTSGDVGDMGLQILFTVSKHHC